MDLGPICDSCCVVLSSSARQRFRVREERRSSWDRGYDKDKRSSSNSWKTDSSSSKWGRDKSVGNKKYDRHSNSYGSSSGTSNSYASKSSTSSYGTMNGYGQQQQYSSYNHAPPLPPADASQGMATPYGPPPPPPPPPSQPVATYTPTQQTTAYTQQTAGYSQQPVAYQQQAYMVPQAQPQMYYAPPPPPPPQ